MLERRVLLSANPVTAWLPEDALAAALPQQVTSSDPVSVMELGNDLNPSTYDSSATMETRKELIFVDAAVQDQTQLIEEIRATRPGRALEIYLLDAKDDGVDQITEILADHRGIDAIHLLSHGSDAQLRLGNGWLDAASLNTHAGSLARWGISLSEDADLLLYGCDLAESDDGKLLVDAIATLTGADVAASTDETGTASLGGNWDLEYQTGDLEWQPFPLNEPQSPWSSQQTSSQQTSSQQASSQQWSGLLNAPTLQPTDELLTSHPPGHVQELDHANQSVAVDGNGNSIVVWTDHWKDGDGTSIVMRRADSNGSMLGSATLANVTSAGDQSHGVVAADASGRFVIAWISDDANGTGVYLRRFDADGNAIDNQDLLVSAAGAAGTRQHVSIACNDNDQIVIAWQATGTQSGIFARTFDFSSTPGANQLATPLITVDATTSATTPSIDLNANGRYVVVWKDASNVWGRKFDFGSPVAVADRLDLEAGTGTYAQPVVAVMPDNSYVVAFRSEGGMQAGIWKRVIHDDDTMSIPLEVSGFSTTASTPAIAMDASGNYLITYTDADSDQTGIYLRVYSSSHLDVTGVQAANQSLQGIQENASAAIHNTSNYVIVWSGAGDQSGQADSAGVFLRQYGSTVTNQVPSIANATQSISYTEDAISIPIGAILVSDSDVGDTITATLTLDLPATGSLTTGVFGVSTSSYNIATGVWQISGSVTDVNAALATLRFVPSTNNDSNSQIVVHVQDASGASPADETIQLNVAAINDAPELDLDADDSNGNGPTGYSAAFIEGSGAVSIVDSADASLTDVDDAALESLTVRITNSFDGASELLSVDTAGTSLIAVYSGSTLTISGTDLAENYQRVLRTVRYNNTSLNPNTTDRIISFVADDGGTASNVSQSTVTIQSVNQAPGIVLPGFLNASEDLPAALAGISFSDPDIGGNPLRVTLSVSQGILSIDTSISGGLTSVDVLGSGESTVTIQGTISEINQTFAAHAGVIYLGDENYFGTDTLSIVATDAWLTTTAQATVEVASQNDAPVSQPDEFSAGSNSRINIQPDALLRNDSDIDGPELSVRIVSRPSVGTLLVLADGTLQYTAPDGFSGRVSFTYVASDGTAESDPTPVTLSVVRSITAADIVSAASTTPSASESSSPAVTESSQQTASEESDQESSDSLQPAFQLINRLIDRPGSTVDFTRNVIELSDGGGGKDASEAALSGREESTTESAQNQGASLFREAASTRLLRGMEPAISASMTGSDALGDTLVWTDFVEVREQLTGGTDPGRISPGQFVGFTSALSVGYVLWTIRSGLLATSLLAHLPAWSIVDPLLVLSDLDNDSEADDDDSIEEMLDHDAESNPERGEGLEQDSPSESLKEVAV